MKLLVALLVLVVVVIGVNFAMSNPTPRAGR